jgi:hypothetical protein
MNDRLNVLSKSRNKINNENRLNNVYSALGLSFIPKAASVPLRETEESCS